MSISLSFDVGHSSIGWAAMNIAGDQPVVLGCGSVVFPAEDCQNQQRAGFRRQRRHIAATRNRIKRLEAFLVKTGAMSDAQIERCREEPNPWPWLLAAKVIAGNRILNWSELWPVLRWYAHNRGYDGNALWAGEDSDPDDVKKVKAARELMERHDTSTMCETVCGLLEVDIESDKNPRLEHYFKGENAAFPRNVVVAEVRQILKNHLGKLDKLTDAFINALLSDWTVARELGFDPKLPARYCGGLLFGQLKPRFENRIIPTCRLTGEKTPSKHSRDFYRYRWAMLVNNLRVEDIVTGLSRPLLSDERVQLNSIMEAAGYLNKTTLKKAFEKTLKLTPSNLEAMFLIPEMEQALTLDPALREVHGTMLKKIWTEVPEDWRGHFLNQLFHSRNFKGAPASLSQWRSRILEKVALPEKFDVALEAAWGKENTALSKKGLSVSFEAFCNRPIRIAQRHLASGRAPYARPILQEAVESVFNGEDPRAVGGVLEETEEVRNAQRDQAVDGNTNNHLVRHRLKIFTRTLSDLVKRYADNDPSQVSAVGVEVVRDLVQFSGKTAKEKAQIIGQQLWHHRKVSKYLEEQHAQSDGSWAITPGLIKKVRIADDLDWTCPYTGKKFSLNEIIHGEVDREHIIPRSKRPTDSMHSLVMTFSDINREKGARTGMQYIEDTQNSTHTFTPQQYKNFVTGIPQGCAKKLKRGWPWAASDQGSQCEKTTKTNQAQFCRLQSALQAHPCGDGSQFSDRVWCR